MASQFRQQGTCENEYMTKPKHNAQEKSKIMYNLNEVWKLWLEMNILIMTKGNYSIVYLRE